MANQTEKKVLVSVDTNEAKKGLSEFISKLKELFNNILGVTDTAKKEFKNVDSAAKSTGNSLKNALDKKGLTDYVDNLKNLGKGFLNGSVSAKEFGKGVLDVGKSFLLLIKSNPILFGIIGAITTLVALFRTFGPLVDKVEQAFAGLSAAFNILKNGIINFVSGNKSLKDSFVGIGESMKNAAIEGAKLKKVEQDLNDQAVELAVSNAEAKNAIDELILKSKDRTKTEAQRIEYINQAMKLEKEQYEKNLKYAQYQTKLAQNLLINGKNLTNEQIAGIKQGGEASIKYINELIDKGANITDEERDRLKEALITEANIYNQGIQFREKAIARANQLADDAAEKAKAAAEKRKIAEEKEAKERKEREEKAARESIKIATNLENKLIEIKSSPKKEKILTDEEIEQQKRFERGLALAQKNADDQVAIVEKNEKDKQDARIKAVEAAQTGLNMLSNLEQSLTQASMGLLKRKYQEGKITQEEFDKKSEELQKKAAKRQKAFAISQAIIDTAGAIIGFLAKPGGIPGIALSVAAGILGAAQIAAIAATPVDGGSAGSTTPKSSIGGGGEGTAPNTSFSFAPRAAETPQLQPAKAYVISKDIRTQTQLDRQAVANGTI